MSPERNNGINNTVLLGLLLFVMAWSLIPMVHDSVDRLFLIIIVLFSILLVYLRGSLANYVLPSEYNLLVLIGAWILYQCLFKVATISEAAWGTHSEFILFYVMYLIYLYVKYNFSYKYMRIIVIIGYAMIFAAILYFYYLNLHGELRITYDPNELELETIPTMFKQEVLIFSAGCLSLIFLKKNKILTIIALLGIAGSIWTIYLVGNNATSTLLLMAMLLFMIISSLDRDNSSQNYKIYITLIIAIFFLIFVVFGEQIFTQLASITETYNVRISRKLLSVAQLFNGSKQIAVVEGDSLSSRIFCMEVSLKTWLRNPITFLIGIGRKNGYYYDSGIGQHSEFIDVFARFGIIGAIATYTIFVKLYKCLKNDRSVRSSRLFSIAYLILMVLGFLNNIIYPQMAVAIFFIWVMTLDLIDAESDYVVETEDNNLL